MKRILVPVDGSDRSIEALEFACSEYPDATVHILHVAQVTEFPEKKTETPLSRALEDGEQIVVDARSTVETDQRIETVVRHGETTRTIISVAEELGVDAIVIASRGKSGVERLLLGSVAETVVRRASVPVVVVR